MEDSAARRGLFGTAVFTFFGLGLAYTRTLLDGRLTAWGALALGPAVLLAGVLFGLVMALRVRVNLPAEWVTPAALAGFSALALLFGAALGVVTWLNALVDQETLSPVVVYVALVVLALGAAGVIAPLALGARRRRPPGGRGG